MQLQFQGYSLPVVTGLPVLAVAHSGTVYYGPDNTVSPSNNTGSLTDGQSLTVDVPTWFYGATGAYLEVDQVPFGGVPIVGTHAARPSTGPPRGLYYETDTGLAFIADLTGTWQCLTGQDLGYAQITSNFSTASLSLVDVTGLTVTVTTGIRPVMVQFQGLLANNTVSDGVLGAILEDGVVLQEFYEQITSGTIVSATCRSEVRRAATPGSHTYKIQLQAVTGGTASVAANTNIPAFIRVVELDP